MSRNERSLFFSDSEREIVENYWQEISQWHDNRYVGAYLEEFTRREQIGEYLDSHRDIAYCHGFSPIERIIGVLKNRDNEMSILDLGGGACIYAAQIRHCITSELGKDRCRVYTTGLNRKIALEVRRKVRGLPFPLPKQLHPNDLVARSIFELPKLDSLIEPASKPPELFDIILSTFGEGYYVSLPRAMYPEPQKIGDSDPFLEMFIVAICQKLHPNGFASIVGISAHHHQNIKAIVEENGCQFKEAHPGHSIQIER